MDGSSSRRSCGRPCSSGWDDGYLLVAGAGESRGVVVHVITVVWISSAILVGMIVFAPVSHVWVLQRADVDLVVRQKISHRLAVAHAIDA